MLFTDKPRNKYFIYVLINRTNGKKYIGYTSKHWSKRFKEHFWNSKYSNTALSRAIRKYGIEVFDVQPLSSAPTRELAKLFEQRVILTLKTYGSGYNMTPGGDGSGRPSIETRAKMSKARIGKKLSKESREKIRLSKIGKKNPPVSQETREKLSKANKGHPVSKETRKKISESLKRRFNSERELSRT
jgi:group I intron endonuclease